MLLHSIAWYCIVSYGILYYLYCIDFHDIACYCVVGFGTRAVFCKMPIYIIDLSYVFFWRGRICLLIEIGGNNNFEENAFKLNLFLMILPFLVFLAIWHFRAKVFSIKKFKHCDSDSDILRRSSFWAVSVRWEGRAV